MDTGTMRGTELAGRYRVGALLGQGGMADVYDALDLRLDRPVAVKVLRPAMAANPDVRRRFEAEARSAARLSHPNVVSVYDTGEDDGVPFIVMERLPGETVADRIARGEVDERWLKRVAGDILLALGAAHAAGLIHRDVKPGNVLIADNGCAKVADFGIAKSTEALAGGDLTATNMLVGTPAYLAPERIDGHPATPQSDLYSLGVLLYEALAGRKPFPGQTPLAVANAVRSGSFTPLAEARPDADPHLVRAASKAMARRPEDRYGSAEEMRAALEDEPSVTMFTPRPAPTAPLEVDATVPVTATLGGPTLIAPAPVPGKRTGGVDRRLLLACGGGLVALLLIAAFLNLRGSGGSSPAAAASDANKALAGQLRDLGTRVHDGDGAQGPALQQRLDTVAGDLDGVKPAAGADATALLEDVTAWRQDPNQLSAAAADQSTTLLKQVPGVDAAAATPPTTAAPAPPTTTAPTTAAPKPAPAPKPPAKHKGKKGD